MSRNESLKAKKCALKNNKGLLQLIPIHNCVPICGKMAQDRRRYMATCALN